MSHINPAASSDNARSPLDSISRDSETSTRDTEISQTAAAAIFQGTQEEVSEKALPEATVDAPLRQTIPESLENPWASCLIYNPKDNYRNIKPSECYDNIRSLQTILEGDRPAGFASLKISFKSTSQITEQIMKLTKENPNLHMILWCSKGYLMMGVGRGAEGRKNVMRIKNLLELMDEWKNEDYTFLENKKLYYKDPIGNFSFYLLTIASYRMMGRLLSYPIADINEFGRKKISYILNLKSRCAELHSQGKIHDAPIEKFDMIEKLSDGLRGHSHDNMEKIDEQILNLGLEIEDLIFSRRNSLIEYQK